MPGNKNEDIFDFMLEKAFEKYAEDIADEPVPELTEEAQAYMEESKKRVYKNVVKQARKDSRRSNHKSIKKIVCLVAVLSVIGALYAMNATAFKSFIYKTYTTIEGNVMKISADYNYFEQQYDSISNFKNKSEIIVPGWMPNETKLIKVEDEETFVRFRYETENNYFDFREYSVEFGNNHSEEQLENNKYKSRDITVLGMNGSLVDISHESEVNIIIVIWSSDNVKYEIKTDLSQTVLMSIINNLKYCQ